MRFTTLAGVAVATALMTSSAHAQSLPDCNAAGSFAPFTMTFVACYGAVPGNDPNGAPIEAEVKSAFLSYIGAAATVQDLGKSDGAGAGPFVANVTDPYGFLEFDTPVFGYFALILKGSNGYSGYLMDAGASGLSGVSFNMAGTAVNQNGIVQDLSHARLLSISGPDPSQVPEPASATLLALGVAGLLFARRRRR